jgi:uncharacterized protein
MNAPIHNEINLAEVTPNPAPLAPLMANKRIHSMDVIRGFALIGIFFMNVEWFNRTFAEFSTGLPASWQGIDLWAGYFVNYFVAGKFWTIFSLLFGMGFAVMLTSAQDKGSDFIKPYVRRIIALGVFGLLHTLLLWPGDILYSYAFTAAGLLIILFGQWKWILAGLIGMAGIAAIPNMDSFAAVPAGVAFMSVLAFYLRSDKSFNLFGVRIPLLSGILGIIGILVTGAALASFFVDKMQEAKIPLCVSAFFTLLTAFCSAHYYQPRESRLWRIGAFIYLLPFLIMLAIGLSKWNEPVHSVFDSPAAVALAAEKATEKAAQEKLSDAQKEVLAEQRQKTLKSMSKERKKLEEDAERINRIHDLRTDIAKEEKVLKHGGYGEFLKFRISEFSKDPFGPAALAFMGIGMFLIGMWFIQSGIMRNARDHLPLFRRIAFIGLPIGIALSVMSSLLAVRHIPGVDGDHWLAAHALVNLAGLPASLAYMSIVILMCYSAGWLSRIQVLAPYGRMALSNYLMQSLIQAVFFFGWGLGNYGMPRFEQLVFAAIVIVLQIAFSHWWLKRFAYGPMEWLWRAITYWQRPKFRITATEI